MKTSATALNVTAFEWVPDFARGQVRDLRVRWMLEEMGRDYRTELLDATKPRGSGYRERQPFGQVPAFDDGDIALFETGAILLYLGEQDERLLPKEPQARWSTIAWLFAGLNSVEPIFFPIVSYDIFHADKPWAKSARVPAVELAKARLDSLSNALGDKDWLTGDFSIADIMMVTVLRILKHTDIVDSYPNLAAYRARGEARPAFRRAIDAQCSDFSDRPPQSAKE